MRSKTVLVILLCAVTLYFLREFGAFTIKYYRSETSSSVSSGIASALRDFRDIGSIEIIDLRNQSKIHVISDRNHKIRLSVTDSFIDFSPSRWVPFYKQGITTARLYLKVENNVDDQGWNDWGSIIAVKATIETSVSGLCSANDFKNIIYDNVMPSVPTQFPKNAATKNPGAK